jgi:hypothetical protein
LKDTIADTPQYYGWNHAPNFGESYSLGIKAGNGYYLEDKAVRPWKYDPHFDEYRNSQQYAPVLSQSEYLPYKHSADTAFVELPYQNIASKAIAGGQFHLVADSIFANKGFVANDSDGAKAGWLVWLISGDSLHNINDESLSLLIYRNELKFETGKNAYPIEAPSTNKLVLGGLYIVPQTEAIGKITFYLSGLVSEKDGHWQVVRLAEPCAPDDIPPQTKPTKEGLTPVKKGV